MAQTQSKPDKKSRTQWTGAGLAVMAGVGAMVGLLVAGGTGIALGAAFGAALGLILGAVIDAWLQRR